MTIAGTTFCALLAAGRGSRFGGNKLEANLGGQLLGTYAAQAMVGAQLGPCVAIVSLATPTLNRWLGERGVNLIANPNPAAGLSSSLALAARAAQASDCDALLIVLDDMPFVPVDYLRTLRATFVRRTLFSQSGGVRMPPALFARSLWPALDHANGDHGARRLADDSDAILCDSDMLFDVDTHADLAKAEMMMAKR